MQKVRIRSLGVIEYYSTTEYASIMDDGNSIQNSLCGRSVMLHFLMACRFPTILAWLIA